MKYSTQDKGLYDELFEVICEVVCVKHKTVKIGGDDYPYELVKSKFLKLNSSHLEYVMECMKNTTTKITNIKAYMVTALYNAPNTINHYYQQEVQHDMYGGGWHEKGIIYCRSSAQLSRAYLAILRASAGSDFTLRREFCFCPLISLGLTAEMKMPASDKDLTTGS